MKKLLICTALISSCSLVFCYNKAPIDKKSLNLDQYEKIEEKSLTSKNTFYLKGGFEGGSLGSNPLAGIGYRHLGKMGVDVGVEATPRSLSAKVIPLFKFLDRKKADFYGGLGLGLTFNDREHAPFILFESYYSLTSSLGFQLKNKGFAPKFFQLDIAKALPMDSIGSYNYSVGFSTGIGF